MICGEERGIAVRIVHTAHTHTHGQGRMCYCPEWALVGWWTREGRRLMKWKVLSSAVLPYTRAIEFARKEEPLTQSGA